MSCSSTHTSVVLTASGELYGTADFDLVQQTDHSVRYLASGSTRYLGWALPVEGALAVHHFQVHIARLSAKFQFDLSEKILI
jgi:hypothetical protein